MAIAATRGELGWAKVGAVHTHAISVSPTDEPALNIPPNLGNFYPINYSEGISVPALAIRTSPYAEFWSAAQFGQWFDVSATTRTGELAVITAGTVSYYDGNSYDGLVGVKGDSFTLDIMNGAPVGLTMAFIGAGNVTTGTTAPTESTTTPSAYRNCTFSTATGVHQCTLSFSNRCYPSGELSTDGRPVLIHAGPPVFSMTLVQKPGGVTPTTTQAITIAAPGGSTATFVLTFRITGGPTKQVVFGETLYQRTFTGMRVAIAGVPFGATWA